MGKIVRYEYLGNSFTFWLLCITIVGIPLAILHLVTSVVRVEEEVDDPSVFLEKFRAGGFIKNTSSRRVFY
jgi:hypothetical protein